ncbi:hypothetical protein GCM10007933_32040 [Zoogloea oryzae]|uniref:Uncharacterized protein n=1 Tax=Zoogloea oryzae TaxID=310767 RepID=A0ABQ6FFC8_9RHOO|nr:hypothetical protein GCM10007933_32040 [Zoogloea oryzae]
MSGELGEAATGGHDGAGGGELVGQLGGFDGGSVGDGEAGGLRVKEWQHGATGRAARAQQQHAPAGHGEAQVDGDVAQDAGAVGVVAQGAVGAEGQGVHRAGGLGAGREPVGQVEGFELEGHGDVHPASAGGLEALHGGGEAVEGREQRLVAELLAGLGGEGGVDAGRLAVADRVADHGVTVHRVNPCGRRSAACPRW